MDREKLRDIFRKYRAVGLVLLAGLLLLLLPTGKSSGQERQASDDTQLYSLEETEQRMAQLLGKMSGVGRVQVMLTLKTGPTLQLAQDMDLEQEEGSLRQRSQPVTVNRGSGWQEALVWPFRFSVILFNFINFCLDTIGVSLCAFIIGMHGIC